MTLPRDTTPDPAEARRRHEQDPLLSSVVRAADGARDRDCPDAEWLALYADQALPTADVAVVAPHLHWCERCQATVAAYRRASADAPVDRDLRAIPAAAGTGGLGGWLAGWRWLVPATSLVAVMVVAVWIGREPAEQVASSAAQAGASATAPALETFVRPAAPEVERDNAAARDGQRQMGRAPAPMPSTVATNVTRSAAPAAEALREAAPDARPPELAGDSERLATAASPAASAVQEMASPPVPESNTAAAAGTAVGRAARGPTPPPSWRVVDGDVARSRDDGRTWQRVVTPPGVRVIAVSAPGGDVCWAISANAVLRTSDGVTWSRTSAPSSEPLAGVVARSAHEASVFTTSTARFATSDGGATWSRPQ